MTESPGFPQEEAPGTGWEDGERDRGCFCHGNNIHQMQGGMPRGYRQASAGQCSMTGHEKHTAGRGWQSPGRGGLERMLSPLARGLGVSCGMTPTSPSPSLRIAIPSRAGETEAILNPYSHTQKGDRKKRGNLEDRETLIKVKLNFGAAVLKASES